MILPVRGSAATEGQECKKEVLLTRARSRTFPASDLQRPAKTDIWTCESPSSSYGPDLTLTDGDTGVCTLHPNCKVAGGRHMLLTGAYGPNNRFYTVSAREGPDETRVDAVLGAQQPKQFVGELLGSSSPVRANGQVPLLKLRQRLPSAVSASEDVGEEDAIFLAQADPDSMRAATRLAVIIGQVFSLMPISAGQNQVPRFQFLSFRVLYWAFVTFGLALSAVLSFVDLALSGSDEARKITGTSRWVFYLSATTISVLYFRLARRWRQLCVCFLKVEVVVPDPRRSPLLPLPDDEWRRNPPGLGRRLQVVTILTLSLALAEYSLSQISSVMQMDLENYSLANLDTFFKDRFMGNYPHMLLLIQYSPLALLVTQLLNTTATFVWNYNDLFVMLISLTIARHFHQLNAKLKSDFKLERSKAYWKSARETYNALSFLTRDIDELLGSQILFSFVNNLYFICIQLLHTVKHEHNSLLENVYFVYSFGFLLARTVAVSLTAASINDESKSVKRILYSVPSRSYCEEVERLLTQVTTDEVSLTGMKFFDVSRSFLLTMAGTIATYEIVMVQFSGNTQSS